MRGYIGLPEDSTLYEVSQFFVRRGLYATYLTDNDAYRIETRPSEEPEKGERFRRIQYEVKVELFGSREDCTLVEVRWNVRSRGYREQRWVPDRDADFQPLLWEELNTLFRSHRCR